MELGPRVSSLAMTTVEPGSAAYSMNPALVQSLVNSRLSTSPTLLPETLANLITALSLAARVSIRASALFIEALLESSRLATSASMSITRRALITAVGSARALHYVNHKLDWSGRTDEGTKSTDAFLQVLDKYTNLGIYMIHHTFTLAELFAMSGFYLTMTTIQTGFSAAEESVKMLDGILGSNETSRALSSIITLVRKELTQDPRFTPAERGAIASLTSLTKALTAFAVLQGATHKRTLKEMRLRVVYDCTIVVEGQGEVRMDYTQDSPQKTGRKRSISNESIMTDVRGAVESHSRRQSHVSEADDEGESGDEVVTELVSLIGSQNSSGDEEDQLPQEVRAALKDLQEGKMSKCQSQFGKFEIEVEETTTTTMTTVRTRESTGSSPRKPRRSVEPEQIPTQDYAEIQDDEWVEVTTSRAESDVDDDEQMGESAAMENSVASLSRQDTVDHPEEGRQRLQVVLRTMTKKFTQRKRTIRRVDVASRSSSPVGFGPRRTASSEDKSRQRRAGSRSQQWSNGQDSINTDHVSDDVSSDSTAKGKNITGGISRVFSRAKQSFGRIPSGENLPPRAIFAKSSKPASKISSPHSATTGTFSPPHHASAPPPNLRRTSSMQSMRSVITTCKHSAKSAAEEPEPKAGNYPHEHLVSNLQRFMRYSSAAYGQAFLRILGIGRHDFNFPNTQTHANNHAFAHHVGIKVDDILLSSYTDPGPGFSTAKLSPLINYVAIDHSIKAVVLSCRGSLGLSDILVDLTCTYEPLVVEHGLPNASYYVHSGMFNSATQLQRGTVHATIREALESFSDYGLVLCGHSLGGGVAALLAILWSSPASAFKEQAVYHSHATGKTVLHPPIATPFVTGFSSGLPPGRPIACYSYGPPCVASPDLVRYCEGLVTSTIHNYDIISTLSLGVLQDLKNMATGLNAEGGVAEEIVGRVVGLYQRKFANRHLRRATVPRKTTVGNQDQPQSLNDVSDEAKEVTVSDLEFENGKGNNRALDPAYLDPSLLGAELSEDTELNDWLWSLVKTMRAGNDSDKLYPPGTVYIVENYTVFVTGDASKTGAKAKYSRKEGRRIILRAVDNVETRFSEPVFGRTMLSDHSPHNYEICLDYLFTATDT